MILRIILSSTYTLFLNRIIPISSIYIFIYSSIFYIFTSYSIISSRYIFIINIIYLDYILPSVASLSISNNTFFSSYYVKSSFFNKASTRLLSFPSIYIILNLYYPSISTYRTCRLLSTFIVVNYTRFL